MKFKACFIVLILLLGAVFLMGDVAPPVASGVAPDVLWECNNSDNLILTQCLPADNIGSQYFTAAYAAIIDGVYVASEIDIINQGSRFNLATDGMKNDQLLMNSMVYNYNNEMFVDGVARQSIADAQVFNDRTVLSCIIVDIYNMNGQVVRA